MEFFPDPSKTHRVSLEEFAEDAWVDIKQALTIASRQRINQSVELEVKGKKEQDPEYQVVNAAGLSSEQLLRTFEEAIVAWSFPRELGRDSYLALDEDVAIKLIADINEWYEMSAPDRSKAKNGELPSRTSPKETRLHDGQPVSAIS